ncbi:DUF5696 domain-containing protein [Paenibacillus sp. FSL R7-0210]|uniref:DUF5696 domain-containing protein n=1 Tax=Paenibacillus sp. FSL R7-0210 TaxID=2921676 RepID=UPI0030F5AA8C
MRKPLIMLLSILFSMSVLAGCSASSSGSQASGHEPNLEVSFTEGSALKSAFTDSGVSGMTGVLENAQLRLFMDEATGGIAVKNLSDGTVWYSNPLDREADAKASGDNKDLLSAQLKLDFYNNLGQVSSVNSYTDSVAHKQMKMELTPEGVKVFYQFGTTAATAEDLPMKMGKERFEEKIMSKMDKTGQRTMKIAYTFDEENGVYTRNDEALKGLQLERTLKGFEKAGYTEEDLQQDIAENKLSQTKPAPRIFQLAIEYALDGDQLVVKVPAADIRYPADYPVNDISLLSFLGAGGSKDSGSILVPDGSGALIHFNNGKIRYPAYKQAVYGVDGTMETTDAYAQQQEVKLPVFGLIREEGAMLGIIEQGASLATINADTSGRLNGYNYVYPSFTLIAKGDLTLTSSDQNRTLPKFQQEPPKTDYVVRYAFLSGAEASYPGMARYYQSYLAEHGGLPEAQPAASAEAPVNTPFYLELVGGITKTKHVLGIPYQSLEALTTFEEAQSILEQMKQRGIDHIKLKYAGWFNRGLDHKVPDRLSVDQAIGGSKGLNRLAAYAKEQDIQLFPDIALLRANQTSGFRINQKASRMLSEIPAAVYPYNMALNRRDRSFTPAYIISPSRIGGYVDATLKEIAPFQTGGISLRDMADQLNSDFRKNQEIDRSASEQISVQSLEKITGQSLRILADGGNAYALPYLSDITDAPVSSSRFKLEDEEIPFYPMVVRGYVNYTGKPFNLSTFTNPRQYILKSLEYGSGIYYEWMYAPNYKVKDTDFDNLYAVNYEQWINQAADMYTEVNGVMKNVQNQRLTGHEKLADGVYKSTYGNGMSVIVNYNKTAVLAEGRTVEAESYITGGEQS